MSDETERCERCGRAVEECPSKPIVGTFHGVVSVYDYEWMRHCAEAAGKRAAAKDTEIARLTERVAAEHADFNRMRNKVAALRAEAQASEARGEAKGLERNAELEAALAILHSGEDMDVALQVTDDAIAGGHQALDAVRAEDQKRIASLEGAIEPIFLGHAGSEIELFDDDDPDAPQVCDREDECFRCGLDNAIAGGTQALTAATGAAFLSGVTAASKLLEAQISSCQAEIDTHDSDGEDGCYACGELRKMIKAIGELRPEREG